MALPREELISRVQRAIEEGLMHPHQPKLEAIEGELDSHELAEFIVDYVQHKPAGQRSRAEVIQERLAEM